MKLAVVTVFSALVGTSSVLARSLSLPEPLWLVLWGATLIGLSSTFRSKPQATGISPRATAQTVDPAARLAAIR